MIGVCAGCVSILALAFLPLLRQIPMEDGSKEYDNATLLFVSNFEIKGVQSLSVWLLGRALFNGVSQLKKNS